MTIATSYGDTGGMSRSQFPLADRLVGGDLKERIAAWRAEGLSFNDIAIRLREEHSIAVTDETVRRWAGQFVVDTEPAA